MTDALKIFVYGLTDPRNGLIRYIGKTVNGMKRPRAHGLKLQLDRESTHKANWIRQLQQLGLSYGVIVLETVPEDRLSEAEILWIARGRDEGWPLTNLTDGGDGCRASEETRSKMSLAKKGKKFTEEHKRKNLRSQQWSETFFRTEEQDLYSQDRTCFV
jgi:hypothetical protein